MKDDIVSYNDENQRIRHRKIVRLLKNCPIPDEEILYNLGLFLPPSLLSRILFLNFLYNKILDVHGSIFDLGIRWGQNMSLFCGLRGIYEPFNRTRKIIGFDTFEGFIGFSEQDGNQIKNMNYAMTDKYEKYLIKLLGLQEKDNPISFVKRHEVIKGDACDEIGRYLERYPETIIALAYFDFDLYEPTKIALRYIENRLTRGSILAFDELNEETCPGETLAVKEVLGLDKYAIKRFQFNSRCSYLVID